MNKRVTLTFNLDIEEQKETYEYLQSLGRNKSREVCRLVKNKDKASEFDYDDLVNRLLSDERFKGISNETENKERNEDEEFILNGLQGFY